jgi:hypothetical protein
MQKEINIKLAIKEKHPRILRELVADPLVSAEHTLGKTASKKYNEDKDRQCTYNVTLRHVCVTIVAVEKQ